MKLIMIKVILSEPNFVLNYPSLSLAQLSPSLFSFFSPPAILKPRGGKIGCAPDLALL